MKRIFVQLLSSLRHYSSLDDQKQTSICGSLISSISRYFTLPFQYFTNNVIITLIKHVKYLDHYPRRLLTDSHPVESFSVTYV